MLTLLSIVDVLVGIVAFVAWIFVLIAAFKDEVWKGLLCLFCGIYALYYAATEGDVIELNGIPMGYVYVGCTIVLIIIGFILRAIAPSPITPHF